MAARVPRQIKTVMGWLGLMGVVWMPIDVKAEDLQAEAGQEGSATGENPVETQPKRIESPEAEEEEPKQLTIYYAYDSAASLEGREQVLAFVLSELEVHPAALFSIEAYANDSEFEETAADIAHNRVRFLVDFLTMKGVSDEVFMSVKASATEQAGREGRKLVIRVLYPE